MRRGGKKKLLDRAQMVGYDPNEKKLIVTVSDKMAERMRKDGWSVQSTTDMPPFVTVSLGEVSE